MTDLTLVPVTVPCQCPGAPHGDGDTVYLDPAVGTAAGIAAAAVAASEEAMSFPQRYGLMIENALQLSVRDWTLQHKNGSDTLERIPITPESVRQHLTFDKGGAAVAMKAMELYAESLGLPFGTREPEPVPTTSSSPTGLTESSSTSPSPITRKRRPKPSA